MFLVTVCDLARILLALALAIRPSLLAVGAPAPDFTLTDIDGNSFTLSAQKGSVVLLDFFATWCGPCKAEMPHLIEIATQFPDGLVIVSITTDPTTDSVDKLKQYRTENGITWRILRDTLGIYASQGGTPGGSGHFGVNSYGVQYIPSLFIIDANGIVRFTHEGTTEASVLKSEIAPLIVPRTATQLTLTVSSATVTVGTQVTISGSLSPLLAGKQIMITITCPNSTTITRTVTTSSGGAFSTTVRLDRDGTWKFKASFAGDVSYKASTSAESTVTVAKLASQLSLSLSATSATLGSSITLTGTLSPAVAGAQIAVRITRPDATSTTQTVTTGVGGAFTMTVSPDREGMWKFKASYSGGSSQLAAESAEVILTVTRMPTQVTLSLSASSVDTGSPVTVAGSLSPSASGVTISIIVTKPDSSTTTQSVTTVSGGVFSTTITPDKDGTWRFRATYAGDATRLPSESAEVTLTVKAPFPLVLVGETAIGVVIITGAIWYLKLRKPTPSAQPPPPPPPPPAAIEQPATPAQIPPPPTLSASPSSGPKRLLPFALSGVFVAAILVGFGSQYGSVQAFVRFLCTSCVGLA